MINTIDRLAVIRVAEVMNTDIVFVRDSDTMQAAAQRIHANRISGILLLTVTGIASASSALLISPI